ncbi:copper resistance D family protein [Pleionea mediterranea]|uniref:Copper resistance protein D n=1 Tax=Pleionea mediterranea TaxID=523701 RepID=A0A316FHX8_9GAMM|nr:CopD family protein [Pleionea mediterranea]PWK47326.1 putative copper resistance protein D [Pleionea mediterranea]
MDITIWNLVSVISKVFLYLGFSFLIALPLMYIRLPFNREWHGYIRRLFITGVGMAFVFNGVYFFGRVGSFSESGITGLFDTEMISLLWDSGVGDSFRWRLMALFSISVAAAIYWFSKKRVSIAFAALLYLGMIYAIGLSFGFIGHTAGLSGWMQLILGVHVVIALSWIGSLLALRHACYQLKVEVLHKLMNDFSKVAQPMVLILVGLGGYLVYTLLSEPQMLLKSAYGNFLLTKLALVLLLLGLAARHKLILVPRLECDNASDVKDVKYVLARSIGIEFWLAFLLVIVTAVLSTVVGPMH